MRVLVTGAAGFIGSHLCEALLAAGDEVVGLDGFVASYGREHKVANLARLREQPRFTFHELDLRTDELDVAVEGVEAVINEAAMAGLTRSWTEFDLYIGCNLSGLQRLLDASVRHGVRRFLQASTSSVYGVEAVGDEDRPLRPVSPYGVSKLAGEYLVRAFAEEFGLASVILRYFSIYGPRQRPDMAYHKFTEAMLDGRPITIHGDGEQTRSNTYVADCVRGTMLALCDAPDGALYNIGGGETISLNEAVRTIADALGVEPRIRHDERAPGDQRHTAADVSRARAAIGYEPEVGVRDGLRRQVAWHVERRRTPAGAV